MCARSYSISCYWSLSRPPKNVSLMFSGAIKRDQWHEVSWVQPKNWVDFIHLLLVTNPKRILWLIYQTCLKLLFETWINFKGIKSLRLSKALKKVIEYFSFLTRISVVLLVNFRWFYFFSIFHRENLFLLAQPCNSNPINSINDGLWWWCDLFCWRWANSAQKCISN